MIKPNIAIIGAGISGLTLANELADIAEITIFEKSRGVGGRMATRRTEMPNGSSLDFDHGTQFFTAKSPDFQTYLNPLIQQGLLAQWTGKVIAIELGKPPEDRPWSDPHYVAVPTMNSLAKHLAQSLNIRLNTQVARLPQQAERVWHPTDIDGNALGSFEWVISTAPPAQTISLFAGHIPITSPITEAEMQGCYTLMLGFNQPWNGDWIAAKIRNSPIEWVAINSTKPGRNRPLTSVVAHSSNTWAKDHIDNDQDQTKAFLLNQLGQLDQLKAVGLINVDRAEHISMHRWRYALKPPLKPTQQPPQFTSPFPQCFVDPSTKLASTGDWCSASRIEDVWLAARSLANTLRIHL